MTVLTSEDVDRICLEIMRKIPASTRHWMNSSGLFWTAPNRGDACFIEGALAFTGDLTVLRDTLTIRDDEDERNGCVCRISPDQIVSKMIWTRKILSISSSTTSADLKVCMKLT